VDNLAATNGGQVRGIVVTQLPSGLGTQDVALPNATVYLTPIDTTARVPGSVVATDPNGQFVTARMQAGTYRVCAEAVGFQSGCAVNAIVVTDHVVHLRPHLLLRANGGFVFGHVSLKGVSVAARPKFGSFGAAGAAPVSLMNAAGAVVAGPVSVNGTGIYVLGKVTSAANLSLTGAYEADAGSRTISLSPDDLIGTAPVDLTIGTTPPRVASIQATLDGRAVTQAPPAATVAVTVAANDANGNQLHYLWADANGDLTSIDAPTVHWHLQNAGATNRISVEVASGKGGVARATLALPTAEPVGNFALGGTEPNRQFLPDTPKLPRGLTNPGAVTPGLGGQVGPFRYVIPTHSGLFIDPAVSGQSCATTAAREAGANLYYQKIGVFDDANGMMPSKNLGSFTAWRATSDFCSSPDTLADGEYRAVYFNNGDLQFGRDMHCRQVPGRRQVVRFPFSEPPVRTACYVTNYSSTGTSTTLPGGDPQESIGHAEQGKCPIATVAMLSAVVEAVGAQFQNTVEFFVDDANGNPLQFAKLDSDAPRVVQGICLACHGGAYDSTAHTVTDARFLPFDMSSYIFDVNASIGVRISLGGPPYIMGRRTPNPFSEANERESFRNVNRLVRDANKTTTGSLITAQTVNDLIDGWYAWCGGVGATGCTIDETGHPFVPSANCTDPSTPPPAAGRRTRHFTVTCRGCFAAPVTWRTRTR
jgi:hypothetical protein